jgi:multidrug efflux pump subunit AcrA (membrane-fusion protein)
MTERTRASWLVYLLGALCAGAIAAAFLLVGPASGSQTSKSRLVTVAQGVVQATVSGSGTLQSAKQIGVNFASGGTLKGVFVSAGQHVTSGQLLAEIDPTSADSGLKSAELSLESAQASYQHTLEGLTPQEAHQNEVSVAQGRTSISSAERSLREAKQTAHTDEAGSRASVAQAKLALSRSQQSASLDATSQQDSVNQALGQRNLDQKAVTEARTQLEEARSRLSAERAKSPANEAKVSSAEGAVNSAEAALKSDENKVTQDGNSIVNAQNGQASAALKDAQSLDSASNSVANAKQSQAQSKLKDAQSIAQARTNVTNAKQSLQATQAANTVKATPQNANVVSAATSVGSAKLSLESARLTVANTKLYAPDAGTIASVSSAVGQAVSGSGASSTAASSSSGTGTTSSGGTSASSGSGASGGSSAGKSGTSTAGKSGTSTASAGSTSGGSAGSTAGKSSTSTASTGSGSSGGSGTSSSSTSSSFIELTDLEGFQLVVPLSESEVGHVRVGQIATVTMEALESRKVAAHVTEIAVLSTSNSGVVSYNVTFQLDQLEAGLKPGMNATAEVVVNQAEGVNIPTSAISGGMVTVVRGGKDVRQRVVTGLAGNSSTMILSGLEAGEQILLPVSSSTGTSSLTSRIGSRLGGGGLGGGFGGGGGPGGGGGGPGGGGGLAVPKGGG